MTKGGLKKREYYKSETVQIVLFPFFLIVLAALFIQQGWVTPEQAGLLWSVIIINTAASLLALLTYYLFAEE